MAPTSCATTYSGSIEGASAPRALITNDTAGLKCAPLTGPNTSMRTYRPPTVASALASRAMAMFPPDRRSAMMPEPITTASNNAVPRSSANSRCRTVLSAPLASSNFVQALLQHDPVQLQQRQVQEQLDAILQQIECLEECAPLVLVRAFRGRWILDPPVRRDRLSGP